MKRFVDVVISLSLLILLSPVFIGTALLIRWKLGSPVLFTQKRIGFESRLFTIYKFRTMTAEFNDHGDAIPEEDRMTPIGGWIRRLSLDELPQLLNVLKGDMSLIGPRPLLPQYLPYYTDEEAKRHSVRPGITGLAQVSGRNFLKWEERFELDVQYVRNRSIMLDLYIAYVTMKKFFTRHDIEEFPGESMADFDEERRQKLKSDGVQLKEESQV